MKLKSKGFQWESARTTLFACSFPRATGRAPHFRRVHGASPRVLFYDLRLLSSPFDLGVLIIINSMVFSQFTFSFSVPGLSNPFSESKAAPSDVPENHFQPLIPPQPRHRLSPIPGPSTSRKRGWEPAFAEPSCAETSAATTSGYLDTPAKYRNMANAPPVDEQAVEDMIAGTSAIPPHSSLRVTLDREHSLPPPFVPPLLSH